MTATTTCVDINVILLLANLANIFRPSKCFCEVRARTSEPQSVQHPSGRAARKRSSDRTFKTQRAVPSRSRAAAERERALEQPRTNPHMRCGQGGGGKYSRAPCTSHRSEKTLAHFGAPSGSERGRCRPVCRPSCRGRSASPLPMPWPGCESRAVAEAQAPAHPANRLLIPRTSARNRSYTDRATVR
jgi:hypothetical protein